jgi:hypothetical protein
MTTSTASERTTWFDRTIDWILDSDGDIYGDERSRLRWYEAIAATASVQWILLLWVLAAASWLAPASATAWLWALAAAFVAPLYLSIFYLWRRGVDVTRLSKSRKSRVIQLFTYAPVVAFLVGMTIGRDLRAGRSWSEISPALRGAVVGGLIGLVLAAGLVVAVRRRVARQGAGGEDLD